MKAVRRVLVTRAAHQAGKLSEALREAGFEPVEVPVLEIRPPLNYGPLDAALQKLNTYDWLIVTSANTVRAFQQRAVALGLALRELVTSDFPQVAAIGEATASAAINAGLFVALVPEKYVAESLVDSMGARVAGRTILLARAEVARDVIPDALRAAGATVHVVDAYRTVMPESAPDLLRGALEHGIDAATFTSSSSVTHLADAARAAGIQFPLAGVRAISIGPITSATLREYGWIPAAEAKISDIAELVAAIAS